MAAVLLLSVLIILPFSLSLSAIYHKITSWHEFLLLGNIDIHSALPSSPYLQLLSKPKFSGVEKIKTIGSTYMAAAGLSGPPEQSSQVLTARR